MSSRGGIRTRTGVTAHRILSPVRLPFRHSANQPYGATIHVPQIESQAGLATSISAPRREVAV